MRKRRYAILVVLPMLIGTLSFAQETRKGNPYAALGHTPYVAGAEKQSNNVFVIENFEEGSVVGRIEHNPLIFEPE
ncbi:MAG: hypothetical protein LBG19_11210 [Prevotellaceae bacterium]|jgi:hypothetical protein|nr:hypothetical protein [Prevotellaceae bacterium]